MTEFFISMEQEFSRNMNSTNRRILTISYQGTGISNLFD